MYYILVHNRCLKNTKIWTLRPLGADLLKNGFILLFYLGKDLSNKLRNSCFFILKDFVEILITGLCINSDLYFYSIKVASVSFNKMEHFLFKGPAMFKQYNRMNKYPCRNHIPDQNLLIVSDRPLSTIDSYNDGKPTFKNS